MYAPPPHLPPAYAPIFPSSRLDSGSHKLCLRLALWAASHVTRTGGAYSSKQWASHHPWDFFPRLQYMTQSIVQSVAKLYTFGCSLRPPCATSWVPSSSQSPEGVLRSMRELNGHWQKQQLSHGAKMRRVSRTRAALLYCKCETAFERPPADRTFYMKRCFVNYTNLVT